MGDDTLTVYDVVKKLLGNICPVGETNTDNTRFDNLKATTSLVDRLLSDIDQVSAYSNRPEYSMNRAGKFASKFFDELENERP